jgi:hypothetical protein
MFGLLVEAVFEAAFRLARLGLAGATPWQIAAGGAISLATGLAAAFAVWALGAADLTVLVFIAPGLTGLVAALLVSPLGAPGFGFALVWGAFAYLAGAAAWLIAKPPFLPADRDPMLLNLWALLALMVVIPTSTCLAIAGAAAGRALAGLGARARA